MIIIGINAYHGDASACIVRDGRVVAAAEEERFRRVKHWAGFPAQAVRYCLREAGVRLADVDQVAVNSDPKANLLRKLRYALLQRPAPGLVLERIRNRRARAAVEEELGRALPGERFQFRRSDRLGVCQPLNQLSGVGRGVEDGGGFGVPCRWRAVQCLDRV